MKKYLSLTIALMIAASICACGTAANAASSAAEAQSVENAAELSEKNSEKVTENQKSSENVTADQKEPATQENIAAEEKKSAPENAGAEEDETVSPETAAGQEVPAEEKYGVSYSTDPAGNPEAENIPYIDEDAPAEEVPEEAIYDELGAEVSIDEEAFFDSSDEEIRTPPEVAGTYTLYAWDEHGKIMKSEDQNVISAITLDTDGTGTLTFDGETSKISRWGTSGTMFAMFYDEHGAADGTLDDGIIILDPIDNDDILFFYAKEGIDITEALAADRDNYILED